MMPRGLFLMIVLALCLALSASAPRSRAKMSLVINFDVEDYVTPEPEGIDDIPKWLAETMTEGGATGTFFVIGEKARSLEKRGRRDVIEAMARHDIGSHTNFGSIHPTVTEQLEKADWDGGVRLMTAQESAGVKEIERIFGRPVRTLARHGGSYGPQLVCALGRMGLGYTGSPVSLPGRDVVWFANALNFSTQYDGFDDTYYRDDLFGPHLAKLEADLPRLAENHEVVSLFAGHPTKIRAEEFWDLNFYDGNNPAPGEWRAPRLRPLETMATARKNFRRLVKYLKSRSDIEVTSFGNLMDLYVDQREFLTRDELVEVARRTLKGAALFMSEHLSPAEALAGLAESIEDYRREGRLPKTVKTIHPLGPLEIPISVPETARVTLADVYGLAEACLAHLREAGAMPEFGQAGERKIGAGSLFALFSYVYLDMVSGRPKSEYGVPAFEPYPKTFEKPIIEAVMGLKSWPVHRRDLDMSRIADLTRAQLWTLKPAHRR
jgi:peptidoglycan/xylan/chitin deacetylase (PgdA/CDA1 family)